VPLKGRRGRWSIEAGQMAVESIAAAGASSVCSPSFALTMRHSPSLCGLAAASAIQPGAHRR
jgi:trimethylamine:corrinoid methyltransferase-like protein